jgi:hypothetical protein
MTINKPFTRLLGLATGAYATPWPKRVENRAVPDLPHTLESRELANALGRSGVDPQVFRALETGETLRIGA